jgi:hypothetical protein
MGFQVTRAARPGDPQRVAQRRLSALAAATRPEYGMPLHDLLEGRYPPTATLQNAHSDDAAAEWMRNATHRDATRALAAPRATR